VPFLPVGRPYWSKTTYMSNGDAMKCRIRSSGTPMVPPIAVSIGKGKTARRVLVTSAGVEMATAREQTAAVKPPRTAPGLAGRWRWACTDWTAGQTTVTGERRAGPLRFQVQGVVKETRKGWTQSGWVWTVQRKSDRKGTPAASRKGRASSYGDTVRAAYVAGIELEGEVCGLRTVARNTRAGRTFETAARTTARASSTKTRARGSALERSKQPDSVELKAPRTKKVRAPSRQGGLFSR